MIQREIWQTKIMEVKHKANSHSHFCFYAYTHQIMNIGHYIFIWSYIQISKVATPKWLHTFVLQYAINLFRNFFKNLFNTSRFMALQQILLVLVSFGSRAVYIYFYLARLFPFFISNISCFPSKIINNSIIDHSCSKWFSFNNNYYYMSTSE